MTSVVIILSGIVGLLIGRYIWAKPIIVMPAIDLSEEDIQKMRSELDKDGVVKLPTIFKRKKKGAIYLPDSDIEEARQIIIQKNKEAGKDTPISDLIEKEDE